MTRSVTPQRHLVHNLLVAVLLPLMFVSVGAPAATTESTVCSEERLTLDGYRQQVADMTALQRSLKGLLADDLPADRSLEQLLGASPTDAHAVQARRTLLQQQDALVADWPDALVCKPLQQQYEELRSDARWLAGNVRQQQLQWLNLSPALRNTLEQLWQSRQALASSYATLQDKAAQQDIDLAETPIAHVQQQEHQLRVRLLGLLSGLQGTPTQQTTEAFYAFWRDVVASTLPPASTDHEWPGTLQADVSEFLDLARADALTIRRAASVIRQSLWQQARGSFNAAARQSGGGYLSILTTEFSSLRFFLQESTNQLHEEFIERPGHQRPLGALLSAGMRYAFALLGLLLLSYLARQLAKPLLALHEKLTRAVRGKRALSGLARLPGGLVPLMPWLFGWLGLALLENLYTYYRLDTLVALMPVARLYVVYGATALVCEWLILRICQQASVYLSSDQATQLRPTARRSARLIVAPWLLWVFVDIVMGASLSRSLCMLLNIMALYLALGLLLYPRSDELVKALQSILPPRLDPLAVSLFKGLRTILLGPLSLPLLVLAFVFNFFDKLMSAADWYRALTARWFRMRAQGSEESEEEAASAAPVAENYNLWFNGSNEEQELPYIESGLLPALRKPIDRWLEEHTEENTLLLTGERGIGKSHVLEKLKKVLAEEQPDLQIRHASVPAKTLTPESVKQLVGRLLEIDLGEGPAELASTDAERPATLVILDNAQNFFLSKVGGLEAWKTLLSLTNTRLENIFWLVVINNQSWAYLGNVFGRDYQFRNVLRAKRWSQHDIRSLILSRNHLSGFRIRYDDILLTSRGPEAGNIRNAEQRYFSLLWDACRGNPMLALQLWLSSVRTEDTTVTVGLPTEPSVAQVDKLGSNLMFVYAAIVTHENLTSEEIVAVTSLPDNVVRYALKTGFDADFIQRSDDGRYRLVPIWYHAITNMLARKNLLHE